MELALGIGIFPAPPIPARGSDDYEEICPVHPADSADSAYYRHMLTGGRNGMDLPGLRQNEYNPVLHILRTGKTGTDRLPCMRLDLSG